MKKIILPALLSIVLLSSCSQALYKNKYNWVKVEHSPIQVEPRNESADATVATTSISESTDGGEINERVDSITTEFRDTACQRSTALGLTTASYRDPCQTERSRSMTRMNSSNRIAERKNRSAPNTSSMQTYGDRNWGKTLTWVFGSALVLLLLYFAVSPAVFAVTIISVLVIFAIILAAIALFCWLIFRIVEELCAEIF